MSKYQPTERVYLAMDAELSARIDVTFAAAKRDKQANYSRSEYLQYLLRYALDNKEDIKGARAALAYRVGDRLAEKISNHMIVQLAVFYLIAAKFNVSDTQRTEAFLWAVRNGQGLEDRVAELRHSVSKQDAPASDDDGL